MSSCLANQTFARVAADGQMPVGIIMGKNIRTHRCPLSLKIRFIQSILSLLFSKEGRAVSKLFQDVSNIDRELLDSSQTAYGGEVAFFAVDTAYRGKGLGKELFHTLIGQMKKENISEFFLFTDTSCHFKFYEHQGMTRKGEKEHLFTRNGQQETMRFFLYEYRVNAK